MASIMVNTDTATPTPAMLDILPLVKASLLIAPNDTGRDAQLAWLAQLAVAKYSDIRPRIERVNITSQEGTLSYPLPADCRSVLDAAIPSQYGYYNDWLFLPMIDTPSSSIFGYSDYAFRSPSERIIRQEILTELDHYAQSFSDWYVDGDPPQFYVLPTSIASGMPIIIKYAAEHPNQSADPLNPKWTTLYSGHWKHIIKLVKWALADARADMITSTMALTEQGGGNTQLTESWKLGNRAERILEQVRQDLGVDRTVIIRS